MSSEKISLQPLGEEEEEEKSELGGLQEKLQEDSDCKKAGNQAQRTKTKCRNIFITVTSLLGFGFVNAAVSVIHPFYPIEALKFNVSFYIVGFVIGTGPLCIFLLSPVLGLFLPQLGLKFMQVAGLFLGGGSLFLFGFVSLMPTPTLFIVFSFLLRIVEGIGTAMFSTASFTLLTQLYSERKGAIVGLIELAISVGYIVGAPIGGGLQEVGGFKLPFVLAGGCVLTVTIILFVLVQPRECTSQRLQWRLVLRLFSKPLFVALILSPVISLTGLAAIGANYGRFLYLTFHLRVGIIGAIDLVRSGMYVISSMLAGVLTDKLVPRFLILAGLVIVGVGCIFVGPAEFITTPKLWLSIIAAGAVGFGAPFVAVPVYSDIYKVALNTGMATDVDVIASVLSGITVASMNAGGFVGAIVGGALVAKLHFQSTGLVIGLTTLGYALVLLIISVVYRIKCTGKGRSEPVTVST